MGDTVHRASTVLLLAAVSTVSLFLKDLGLVVAFGGAILGSALVYIMPALMFLKHKRDVNEPQALATRAETGLNIGVALSGVMLAAVGGTMTLKKAGIIWAARLSPVVGSRLLASLARCDAAI